MRAAGFSGSPDVIVIGAGLIGLAAAAALATEGLKVLLLGEPRPGEASLAAAGLLAPSVEEVHAARPFAIASRDRYPSYLEWIQEHTGVHVPLNRKGVLEVALSDTDAQLLHASRDDAGETLAYGRHDVAGESGSQWLDQESLTKLEPSMRHARGALLHELDGAVDNVALHGALQRLVAYDARIWVEQTSVTAIDSVRRGVQTSDGARFSASSVVIAAGAWTSRLLGLPRSLPIEPVRGQMMAMHVSALERPVFGAGIYLVPRPSGITLVGSTMERVGFDPTTTSEVLDMLQGAAGRLCPVVGTSALHASWAGLRPITPDMLPVIDRDPDHPWLYYATGHSRNGILMAPL
ncbi:MAG: FAD-dependent oxidoreductase, partial [Gemmatimonadaceae bacterium]